MIDGREHEHTARHDSHGDEVQEDHVPALALVERGRHDVEDALVEGEVAVLAADAVVAIDALPEHELLGDGLLSVRRRQRLVRQDVHRGRVPHHVWRRVREHDVRIDRRHVPRALHREDGLEDGMRVVDAVGLAVVSREEE